MAACFQAALALAALSGLLFNSSLPMFQSRVGWRHDTESGGRFDVGVWGHFMQDELDPAGGTMEETFDSCSAGSDAWLPLYGDRVWVIGEAWSGADRDDTRGGAVQGINATARESIGSASGFGEIVRKLTDHVALHRGYPADDPFNDDLSDAMRSPNEAACLAACHRFNTPQFGIDFLNWTTEYIGYGDGVANRCHAQVAFHF